MDVAAAELAAEAVTEAEEDAVVKEEGGMEAEIRTAGAVQVRVEVAVAVAARVVDAEREAAGAACRHRKYRSGIGRSACGCSLCRSAVGRSSHLRRVWQKLEQISAQAVPSTQTQASVVALLLVVLAGEMLAAEEVAEATRDLEAARVKGTSRAPHHHHKKRRPRMRNADNGS